MLKAIKRRFGSKNKIDISKSSNSYKSSRESVEIESGQGEEDEQVKVVSVIEANRSEAGEEEGKIEGELDKDFKVKDKQDDAIADLPPLVLPRNSDTPPVWTPPGVPSSPRTFRSVKFNGNTTPEPSTPKIFNGSLTPELSIPKPFEGRDDNNTGTLLLEISKEIGDPSLIKENKISPLTVDVKNDKKLPKYQSPTVTLLQKAREGQLPKGASYLVQAEEDKEKDKKPLLKDNTNNTNVNKKVPGGKKCISPIPLTSKSSHVDKEDQREWYKRMYDNCHVVPEKYTPPKRINYSAPDNKTRTTFYKAGKVSEYNPADTYLKKHWALADRGYESDSTGIIKKEPQLLSPKEQRQLYVEIQKGQDIPFSGLCKVVNNENSSADQNAVRKTKSSDQLSKTMESERNKVNLLQSVIESKLKRSHSDVTCSSGSKSDSASRLIRNVRSKSNIPIRLGKQSELKSPREVGKVVKNEISIKVETEVPTGNGKKSKKSQVQNPQQKIQVKKVKIKSVTTNNKNGQSKSISTPSSSSAIPVKPPRRHETRHSSCLSSSDNVSTRTTTPTPTTATPPKMTLGGVARSTRSPTPSREITKAKDKPKEMKKKEKEEQDKLKPKPTKTSILREIQATNRSLTRSLSSLNYNAYIQNIKSVPKSPQFSKLHKLYSSLDRLNKLNNSKDYYSLTKLPDSKKYDFDAWFKYRNRSRIEQEAEVIEKELLRAQSNREFYFRPKEVKNWRADSALRIKKFSVDEIKNFLLKGDREIDRDLKDLYRLNYRGVSVKESALNMEVNELYSKRCSRVREVYEKPLRRAFSMSSTLSEEQRNRVRNRIKSFIENREDGEGRGRARDKKGGREVITRPMGYTLSSDPYKILERPLSSLSVEESFKKQMSYRLSEEMRLKNVQDLLRSTVRNPKYYYRPYYTFYRTVIDKSFYEARPPSPLRSKVNINRSPSPRTQMATGTIRNRSPSPLKLEQVLKSSRSPSPTHPPRRVVSPKTKLISRLADLLLYNQSRYIEKGSVEKLTDYFESYEVLSKSNPDLTKMRCSSVDEMLSLASRDNYLTKRSRKPIYQPSSSPNVCQATLTSRNYLKNSCEDLYQEIPYEKKILDDRLNFANFDASLHKPKYRYVPQYTSLPIVHHNLGQGQGSQGTTHFHQHQATYITSKVNIHYESPVLLNKKEYLPEEELRLKQEAAMKTFYEEQRKLKYLRELEDLERRRHSDYCVSKSPIPLNRYDEEEEQRDRSSWQKAKVLFDFYGQSKREINLIKGTIVKIKRKVDNNWYEGVNDFDDQGIFPCSYVQPVKESQSGTSQAIALYNFNPSKEIELGLVKGEKVLITKRVDNNWYEGRLGNKIGIFPCNYVKVVTTEDAKVHFYEPNAFQLKQHQDRVHDAIQDHLYIQNDENRYRSLYNYVPQNQDELELKEDDLVQVMEKCDDGWYIGISLSSGLFGTFPGNYVVKIC